MELAPISIFRHVYDYKLSQSYMARLFFAVINPEPPESESRGLA